MRGGGRGRKEGKRIGSREREEGQGRGRKGGEEMETEKEREERIIHRCIYEHFEDSRSS